MFMREESRHGLHVPLSSGRLFHMQHEDDEIYTGDSRVIGFVQSVCSGYGYLTSSYGEGVLILFIYLLVDMVSSPQPNTSQHRDLPRSFQSLYFLQVSIFLLRVSSTRLVLTLFLSLHVFKKFRYTSYTWHLLSLLTSIDTTTKGNLKTTFQENLSTKIRQTRGPTFL